MCAIGRALMARPRLLMLDEPSLGLAPVMVGAIFDNLTQINREGTTALLVEQNVLRALRLSHRAHVLENGAIALEGPRGRLLADEGIQKAYLGREFGADDDRDRRPGGGWCPARGLGP